MLAIVGEVAGAREVWLDGLDVSLARSGRGRPGRHTGADGKVLRIAGRQFKRGLGTHARSDLHVKLFKQARRFTAGVGVEGEKPSIKASVEFVVSGDGKVLFKSGVMRSGAAPKSIDIDVSHVELLTLEVTDAGDGSAGDRAAWASAKFLVAGRDPVAVPPTAEYLFGRLDPFYKKHVSAGGLLIASSEKVSDHALAEAAYLIRSMLAGRDDILAALIRNRVYVGVMAYDQMTTDTPEHSKLSAWMDKRARGLGGNPVTCGEENLLGFKGDPYRGESILIHEFSHIVHGRGIGAIDKTFDTRLKALYGRVKKSGRFRAYGMTNRAEFWAEGAQSWFNCNRRGGLAVARPDGKGLLQINTRDELKKHMPEFARLLAEVFRGNKWTWTPVGKRLDQPHLKGYDPAKAPVFKWPKRALKATKPKNK